MESWEVGNKMDWKIWSLESSEFDIDIDILHSSGIATSDHVFLAYEN